MKKALKIIVLVLAVGFIGMQFFQIDKTNPPITDTETLEAAVAIPPDVALILGRSCNDCHTNKTVYPWYASIQPNGWFLKDHIDEGIRELNFSKFNTFETKKKKKKLEEICEQVETSEMPLPSYLWIHRDAVLSESERKALCDWTKQAVTNLEKSEPPA